MPSPPPIVDELGRYQFTDSLVAALLFGPAPRLLVIDDVHWCDAPTLGLLAHLLHARATAQALIVVTVRPEELDDDHAFVRLHDSLIGEGRVTAVELGRLSPDEAALVADAVAPAPLDAADHARIWAAERGQPAVRRRTGQGRPDRGRGWSGRRRRCAPSSMLGCAG